MGRAGMTDGSDPMAAAIQLVEVLVAAAVDRELERRGVGAEPADRASAGPLERRLQPVIRDLWWASGAKPTQAAAAREAGYQTRSGLQRAMDREDASLGHSTRMWDRLTARRPNRAQPGGTRLHPKRHAAASGVSTAGGRGRNPLRP
jgi:hypothetical protein